MKNVWVSLWEERPVVIKVKDETAGAVEGAEIRKVKLNEEGLPIFETERLGKLRVKTDEWLLNTSLNSTQYLSY